MNGHTFISYAREDQDFVLKLAAKLKDREISIWLDQWDIPTGADWDQTIDEALEKSSQVLVILSPASVVSKQVRGEFQAAITGEKQVVPVLYRECAVPRLLRLIQHIDLTSGRLDDRLVDQLARALLQPHETIRQPSRIEAHQEGRLRWSWILGAALVFALVLGSSWIALNINGENTSQPIVTPSTTNGANKTFVAPSINTGSLQVNVNTERASIYVDGEKLGVAQHGKPLIINKLEIGQHLIRIESEGHEQQTRLINIKENELNEIGVKLHKRTR